MAFVKGYKPTEEHRRRLSESHKGQLTWNKGLKGYNADYPRSEEWKARISIGKKNSKKSTLASQANAKKMGYANKLENHPQWNGGTSFEPYTTDWTDDLREVIRKRDDYVCQECGIHQDELSGQSKKLDVHHIDYIKDNCNPKNLISLCRACHLKTNFNREYWKEYFGGK